MEDLPESGLKVLRSLTPEPNSRSGKLDIATGSCITAVHQEGNPSVDVGTWRRKGRCISTIYTPTRLDSLKTDEGVYRLKKLSTQVEVEHLRSMLHEFERTRLLRTSHMYLSSSAPPPGSTHLSIIMIIY